MKVKSIPSSWMRLEGRRLDCGPYLSGALEAKLRLEQLACRKDRLADLTTGHSGGIYNGPHFSRNFVDGPENSVPFLGSAAMLQADLSEELVEEVEHRERIRVNGQSVLRVLRRKEKTIDDDLPRIAQAFREFRRTNLEPGT